MREFGEHLQIKIIITTPIIIHIQHFQAFFVCSSNFSDSRSSDEKFRSDKCVDDVTIYNGNNKNSKHFILATASALPMPTSVSRRIILLAVSVCSFRLRVIDSIFSAIFSCMSS